jgi:hypothetical protein
MNARPQAWLAQARNDLEFAQQLFGPSLRYRVPSCRKGP